MSQDRAGPYRGPARAGTPALGTPALTGAPVRTGPLAEAVRAWQSLPLTRAGSIVLFVGLAVWVLLVFRDYGISNDEPVQHTYGQLLWAWYNSGFSDTRAFHYKNLYLYGGLFDLVAVWLTHHLPLQAYEARHLLSALFGLVGLAGVWRLAKLFGGEKTAIAAVLMLAVTGMYGGAMFTHTKDVPFAATMVWSLYYISRIACRLPAAPTRQTAIKLGIAVGCALGLRVGGVFAILYLGLTLLAATALLGKPRMLWPVLVKLLPAAPVALAIMAVTWPWSVLSPTNFLEAMTTFSNFAFQLNTLIDGSELRIDRVPDTYMLEYLLVKLPEISLLGLGAALCFAGPALLRPGTAWRQRLVAFLPLALALAVPVVFTLVERPPLYNGIRHFLFVLPPATVVAALGLRSLWLWTLRHRPALRVAVMALAVGLFLANLTTFARLHPYEYVGYNELVGGLAGASGRYEGDYWSATLREASLELTRRVLHEGKLPDHPYQVAVCAEPLQVSTYLGPYLQVTRDWSKADFFITALHVDCDNVMPGPVAFTIGRLGVPLAMVKDLRGLPPDERKPIPPQPQAAAAPVATAAAPAVAAKSKS